MGVLEELKNVWKRLGIKGQVRNFSSKPLWVLETESGRPIARMLSPGFKTPVDVDVDGFKRVDGGAIEGHRSWWKFYDFSTAEVFDQGLGLRVSMISKRAVLEGHFGGPVLYKEFKWGSPIQVISDVRPYIRTRRDPSIFNNLSLKGRV